MTEKLLVVADLGRLKAYRLEENPRFSHPRMVLIEDLETEVNHHLSENLSDQAGQFRKGSKRNSEGLSALSDGEQHNIDLERRRRAVKALARRISELVEREGVGSCYLAADTRINQLLLDEMQAPTRKKIAKNVPANLSKLSPDEVLQHFSE